MSDTRPKWDFATMSEADFRLMYKRAMIVSISAHWQMTSADTADEWLMATDANDSTFRVPNGWRNVWKFYGASSVPGLFALTYIGEQMAKRIEEIDAWEKNNRAERATYERLRKKFEA